MQYAFPLIGLRGHASLGFTLLKLDGTLSVVASLVSKEPELHHVLEGQKSRVDSVPLAACSSCLVRSWPSLSQHL